MTVLLSFLPDSTSLYKKLGNLSHGDGSKLKYTASETFTAPISLLRKLSSSCSGFL